MKSYISLFSILCLFLMLSSGCRESHIEGSVVLTGNMPFPSVSLKTKEGTVVTLSGKEVEKLKSFQSRRVIVYGHFEDTVRYEGKRFFVEDFKPIDR